MSEKESKLESEGEKITGRDPWKPFERWLDYHCHLFERVKLQEDVRDRWFRYYLVIMASTITILGLAFQLAAKEKVAVALKWFFPLLGLFFSGVGILFFLLHLSQRYNYRAFMERMKLLEEKIFYPMLPDKVAARMKTPLPKNPVAKAAVTAQRFFLLINSLTLAVSSMAILQMILSQWNWSTQNWKVVSFAVIVFIACGRWHHVRINKLEDILDRPCKHGTLTGTG
jgi:hypothetical protein